MFEKALYYINCNTPRNIRTWTHDI